MGQSVSFQVTGQFERAATLLAGVRPFLAVHFLVGFQVACLRKGLTTIVASMGFLIAVNISVLLEVTFQFEHLTANFTSMFDISLLAIKV